jgi:hypothetical protein
LTVLASSSPAAGQVVTGVLGFLVVAAMGVALFFLLRSMNKHLRKVTREPRWREEAGRPGPGNGGDGRDGGDGPQDGGDGLAGPAGPRQGQPEPDYSRNGSGQPG